MRISSLVTATLVSLLAVSTLVAADGTASGTITISGKTSTLKYAYAHTKKNPFDAKETDVVVLLTDAPVDPGADTFALMDLAQAGKLSAMQLEFDKDKQVISGSVYGKMEKFNGSFSASGMHKVELTTFTADTIAGKVHVDEDDFFGVKWEYSATFSAPISHGLPVKPAPALKGKALPAGGGEPGKGFRAYLEALRAGDLVRLKATVTADRAKMIDTEPDFKKMLALIQAMEPTNVKIVSGAIDGDRATLVLSGEDNGQKSEGTAVMVLDKKVWRVENESWKSNLEQ
jgi:hypothetical protein